MADVKITALTAIGANPVNPATFPMPMVDLLDPSQATSGSTRKVTVNQILGSGGTATLASATITGALTVDTSTLKVDATNHRVGVVQATPLYPLHLVGEFGLEEASSGNGTKLRLIGDATKYNFRLGKQLTATNTFEITPSTAVGGTTFSNPVYTVSYDGIHTFLDGAGNTRMTLNSTGLSIGGTALGKFTAYSTTNGDTLAVFRCTGTGTQRGLYISADNSTGVISLDASGSSAGSLQFKSGGTNTMLIDTSGNLILQSSATPATLATNGQLTVNATSNTNLRFSYRGSDGTTRVANITLA